MDSRKQKKTIMIFIDNIPQKTIMTFIEKYISCCVLVADMYTPLGTNHPVW